MTSDKLETEAVVPMVRWMLSEAPLGVLERSISIGVEAIVGRIVRQRSREQRRKWCYGGSSRTKLASRVE